jgi:toxin ParE1/3/4
MKLIVRKRAADDLEAIFTWIANDNPRAAASIVRRIRQKLDLLLTPGLANIGRPGRSTGTRELVEGPYVIVYEVDPSVNELSVLAIFHGAQDR